MSQSNPFATRFIRPGAIEFLFPSGQSLEALVDKLRANDWRGQIIGPHGSGKSTLVAVLVPVLVAAGRIVKEVRGRGSEIEGQISAVDLSSLNSTSQVVVDGFEQLSWFTRRKIKQSCQRQPAGLLVTAHRDMGLPTLCRTETSLELARAVVARLMPAGDETINEADIICTYQAAQSNIRETLFGLYDVYQQRQA